MPQQWKYATIMILHKNKDRAWCDNYRGISLVAHAGKILLKIIPRRLREYCERVGNLPEEQTGFRPNCFTTHMMFMIRRLQDLARKNEFRCMYVLSTLTKAYASFDRTLLWRVLARFGVPHNMISIIRQFHDTMSCKHAYGSATECALAGLLWNRAFDTGACSRSSCSTSSSRWLQPWPALVSRRTKISWTLWCT